MSSHKDVIDSLVAEGHDRADMVDAYEVIIDGALDCDDGDIDYALDALDDIPPADLRVALLSIL